MKIYDLLFWDEAVSNKFVEIPAAEKEAVVKRKVEHSDAFVSMLSHILGIGNVLNGGTPKG
jgi:hypothetical protein